MMYAMCINDYHAYANGDCFCYPCIIFICRLTLVDVNIGGYRTTLIMWTIYCVYI